MSPARALGVLGLAVSLAAPAGAAAARGAQPLVNLPPQETATFRDQVGPSTRSKLRAAADSTPTAYKTSDGQTVSVQFSGSYTPDATIAQSYVDFLGSLPHGIELSKLKVYIATPSEVQSDCGGQDGTLACYDPSTLTMTVPGEQEADDGSGITTSYVIAHEYGHHIARFRNNAPFSALNFGPKYWSSLELVCLRAINNKLAPGDEGANYLENPGEAWADTYAHITYPDVMWQFTPLLVPTAVSKAAALRDVQTPWAGPVTKTFTGSLSPSHKSMGFPVPLKLDGALSAKLSGPSHARYDLSIRTLGRQVGHTSGHGSQDLYKTALACREVSTEHVTVEVLRRSGGGHFKLTVTYAG
jgi:hypothetical protein